MDIKKHLIATHRFFSTHRGVGHSELAKIISNSHDAVVIFPTREEASSFVNGVSFNDLQKLDGVRKAAVLDNHTVIVLTKGALEQINLLERRIEKRDLLIQKISAAIDEFETYLLGEEPEKERAIFDNQHRRRDKTNMRESFRGW